MSVPGWRTSLVVHGLTRAGHAVPVAVGLIEGADGGVFVALLVDENREPVVLPLHVASQLIVNMREILLERLRLTGGRLGGDEL